MDLQPGRGRAPQVVALQGDDHRLPFSKGLLATSITGSGVDPWRAYRVAELVESALLDSGVDTVTTAQLRDLASGILATELGEKAAREYLTSADVGKLSESVIILIGGTTGVGKSTVATLLANRLGITRVIPTDAVREVMRASISEELLPAIHGSSFDVRLLAGPAADPVAGYREQVAAVATGLRALVRRAVSEGTDVILEGAHCLPGVLRESDLVGALRVHVVLAVPDAEVHRQHFVARSRDARGRAAGRYMAHFDNIRRLQSYIVETARGAGVPVLDNGGLDDAVVACTRLVLDAIETAHPHPLGPPKERVVPLSPTLQEARQQ